MDSKGILQRAKGARIARDHFEEVRLLRKLIADKKSSFHERYPFQVRLGKASLLAFKQSFESVELLDQKTSSSTFSVNADRDSHSEFFSVAYHAFRCAEKISMKLQHRSRLLKQKPKQQGNANFAETSATSKRIQNTSSGTTVVEKEISPIRLKLDWSLPLADLLSLVDGKPIWNRDPFDLFSSKDNLRTFKLLSEALDLINETILDAVPAQRMALHLLWSFRLLFIIYFLLQNSCHYLMDFQINNCNQGFRTDVILDLGIRQRLQTFFQEWRMRYRKYTNFTFMLTSLDHLFADIRHLDSFHYFTRRVVQGEDTIPNRKELLCKIVPQLLSIWTRLVLDDSSVSCTSLCKAYSYVLQKEYFDLGIIRRLGFIAMWRSWCCPQTSAYACRTLVDRLHQSGAKLSIDESNDIQHTTKWLKGTYLWYF
eukprot:g1429.t1